MTSSSKGNTNLIQLRSFTTSDCQDMVILANNEKIWNNLREGKPRYYHEKDAAKFVAMANSLVPKTYFAIDFNEKFCGIVSLDLGEGIYQYNAEVGIWLGEPFWNLGIGTIVGEKIIAHGFGKLKLKRIYAYVFEYNIESIAVLNKLNFQKEGVLKKSAFKNGKLWDEYLFAILNNN